MFLIVKFGIIHIEVEFDDSDKEFQSNKKKKYFSFA